MLPTQLLTMIARLVEPSDIVSFGSVCRTFRKVSEPAFGKEFFSDILVFMSKASLETLVSICADETIGKHVKSISFASQILENPLEDTTAVIKEVGSPNLLSWKEQRFLQTSGKALRLLIAALTELDKKDQPVTLRLYDYVLPVSGSRYHDRFVKRRVQYIKEAPNPRRALGFSKFKREFRFGDDMSTICEVHRQPVLKILVKAAFDSGCRVPLLNISIEREQSGNVFSGIMYGTYEDDLILMGWKKIVMNKLWSVVEGLECLELSSVLDTDSGYANVADVETAEAFRLLIEHAKRLKVLRVALGHHITQSRYEARTSDEYRGALQACTSTKLREFRLSEVWMSEAQVIKLLE